MKEFIALELRFWLWTVCCGAMLGAAYWVISVFRKIVPHHKVFSGIEDILYWLTAAFLMFAVILVANGGAVRWFAVAGMVLGMVMISYILKYLEKGITIIYNKMGKAHERTHGEKRHKAKQ